MFQNDGGYFRSLGALWLQSKPATQTDRDTVCEWSLKMGIYPFSPRGRWHESLRSQSLPLRQLSVLLPGVWLPGLC